MEKREVVKAAVEGRRPPYVPWEISLTKEAGETLQGHFGDVDLTEALQNHLLVLGPEIDYVEGIGNGRVRDRFGVVWDRSVDKDIGVVEGCLLPEPTLSGYEFPDPLDPGIFDPIPERIERQGDRYRAFSIGFSLYERAWTLRGMENLLMDFRMNPDFVHELFNALVEHNLVQIREALKYDIDAIRFGDDWGAQWGLQMGVDIWREFIRPALKRMYGAAREAGKAVIIHSCGKVDELFDELIDLGLSCFNPFQPEVMDVYALMKRYHGRLAFYGGMSTQRTLPHGTVEDVRAETRRLLEAGTDGGYIFAPAHSVEGDVPLENMLAFIEVLQAQEGFR